MPLHPQAGLPADSSQLINVARLVSDYYTLTPDVSVPAQAVSFGTSGHRGSAALLSFNDMHIAAISQALAEYRIENGITGDCFIGKDTHALSEPALTTAVEVLAANGIKVVLQTSDNESRGYTPTPVISRTIIRSNKDSDAFLCDGVVITPSHNPPEDGGFKYNPPHGGPAGSDITNVIQARANALMASNNEAVKRIPYSDALASEFVRFDDFMMPYINELNTVIDMEAIKNANLKLGTDPLGGAGIGYWAVIAKVWGLNICVVNDEVDARFAFMHRDKDGKLRMDCSSPYAMAGLIKMQDEFDLAFGNDPDFDRHGIVCKGTGLMNPNHYLATVVNYLYSHRTDWPNTLNIGKTLVSSSMIDRVATKVGREITEMPVGFKWFVDGLTEKTTGFAGEESAGGIFLTRNGNTWATDKDGFILCLLAAEMLAVTGDDPATHYSSLTRTFGAPFYVRNDVPTTLEIKKALSSIDKQSVSATELAGEPIVDIFTHASGNNAAIGGIKVVTENGWFAARPSGTEAVYKIYAESFKSEEHLNELVVEAQQLVDSVIS
ncbi:alpha-D-glucose phosphate-specific phosphoglucomutase [Alteromonas sp. 5E99-2]|uniref:phosphoglucomutase (alpha-D-glucose-1,6-bisphosphate-dependent) n=1 Tax=Alteromonas sp. 5E99-2 TaxID=2817683 RepID=UPI001A99D2F6|nr:phosphoglucomutase (alpha-D-glucose-1,6-bisphosphate-dependent) [Alteromonas sp. 5E99-2]MBO1254874.1 alpha-D-glucose phosphate-specific phosphoglucomutase [Alteromonas sp. 5E99-2]